MSAYHVAQLNVGQAVAPMDSAGDGRLRRPARRDQRLGEDSPGFVWRLKGDGRDIVDLQVGDDPLYIVNLTVWTSIDHLHAFTYRSDHKTVFKRRFDWFERHGPTERRVLWWVAGRDDPDARGCRAAAAPPPRPRPDARVVHVQAPLPPAPGRCRWTGRRRS